MALSSNFTSPSLCVPLNKSSVFANRVSSVSFPSSRFCNQRSPITVASTATSCKAAITSDSIKPAISFTNNALNHLYKMWSEKNVELCLRIGVKQGGCSGMSYMMEFEDRSNMNQDDSIIEYDGFMIGTTELNFKSADQRGTGDIGFKFAYKTFPGELAQYVCPAMQNVYNTLRNGDVQDQIKVTILVGAEGVHKLPAINGSNDLKEALQKLGSIPSSKTMAVEVLWTSQDENDTLSERELLQDYPLLRPL